MRCPFCTQKASCYSTYRKDDGHVICTIRYWRCGCGHKFNSVENYVTKYELKVDK